MGYTVLFKPSAARDFERLPRDMQRRLARRIDALADDPYPAGARKLQAAENLFRVRVGDYRVLYQVLARRLVVLVVRVGHCGDVYR